MNARLVHVVAASRNNVIGRDGGMPWRLSSDLKRFRALTMGKPMIMGRKTFASIGRALDGRDNIVVTRDSDFTAPGVIACGSVDEAIAKAQRRAARRGVDEIAVIGGGELYAATIDQTVRIYLTRVLAEVEGDTVYPTIDDGHWREMSCETVQRGPNDTHDTEFVVLERA